MSEDRETRLNASLESGSSKHYGQRFRHQTTADRLIPLTRLNTCSLQSSFQYKLLQTYFHLNERLTPVDHCSCLCDRCLAHFRPKMNARTGHGRRRPRPISAYLYDVRAQKASRPWLLEQPSTRRHQAQSTCKCNACNALSANSECSSLEV